MYRLRGDMTSLQTATVALLIATLFGMSAAGPLGPLPNATLGAEAALKEGSCALGDVVYMPGDEFPGSGPCERCTCTQLGVQCAKQRCEPRPGCKAVHRPDHCCPTYQCECEQEGRVYGNGEKLVDPVDPCRVCYCQGGEVVCRRIACFTRSDCRPRLVPGRCCPEYDNCPLSGVTAIPGMVPSMSNIPIEDIGTSSVAPPAKENVKQEITIKEITPVSEIPVITEVKIKEILPSPSIEVIDYASSKSPLIPREATTEKGVSNEVDYSRTDSAQVSEVKPASPVSFVPSSPVSFVPSSPVDEPTKSAEVIKEYKNTEDSLPSKISLSTQDSINSDIYPSSVASVATMGAPIIVSELIPLAQSTKAPIVEEEDTLFDHNPFPPLPDDLSVLSNHEDEIVPEQTMDGEHLQTGQDVEHSVNITPSEEPLVKETTSTTTTTKAAPIVVPETLSTSKAPEISTDPSTVKPVTEILTSTESSILRGSPMLSLRSAIPTALLNLPSSVPEDITGELDDVIETTTFKEISLPKITSTTTEVVVKLDDKYTESSEIVLEEKTSAQPRSYTTTTTTTTTSTTAAPETVATTEKRVETTQTPSSTQAVQEQSTLSIARSNSATEVSPSTELSSLPIETSDQNPQEMTDNAPKDISVAYSLTELPTTTVDVQTTTRFIPTESAAPTTPTSTTIITKAKVASSEEVHPVENEDVTEAILTSFGSAESATDGVELIVASVGTEKNAAIIENKHEKKNSVLTDLINIVDDVASISDHTEEPESIHRPTTSISDSEELIPVNAGYKSKNNNWNLNSITEVPFKSKTALPTTKQKIVEIEGDDTEIVTDSPPPNDKVEPTTKRPIIDNVGDNVQGNKTEKKDVEIITQSYVPTINRRPMKNVMKKSNEKPVTDEAITEAATTPAVTEVATETAVRADETAPPAAAETAAPATTRQTTTPATTAAQ